MILQTQSAPWRSGIAPSTRTRRRGFEPLRGLFFIFFATSALRPHQSAALVATQAHTHDHASATLTWPRLSATASAVARVDLISRSGNFRSFCNQVTAITNRSLESSEVSENLSLAPSFQIQISFAIQIQIGQIKYVFHSKFSEFSKSAICLLF